MRAALALMAKDLREHAATFGLAMGLTALIYGALLHKAVTTDDGGSAFLVVGQLLSTLLCIMAAALCNRLVVREYYGGTHRFLEALPISRLQVVAAKFALGLAATSTMAGAALGVAIAAGAGAEAADLRFILILCARCGGWVLWLYSTLFLVSLLGRIRYFIYLLTFIGVILAGYTLGLETSRFPPYALIDPLTFAFERFNPPMDALKFSLGWSAAAALLGGIIATAREGAVVTALAQPSTRVEKAALVALALGGSIGVSVVDGLREPPPFEPPGAEHLRLGRAHVAVTAQGLGEVGGDREEAARALATWIAQELDEMATYLDLAALPPVYLVHRSDLDPRLFKRARLENAEGLVVQARFDDPAFDREAFLRYIIPRALGEASDDRVYQEQNNWIFTGFGSYWVGRALWGAPLDADRPMALRALYAGEEAIDPATLRAWFAFEHAAGDEVAEGLAWMGLRVLRAQRGEAATRRVLRAVLSGPSYPGVLATLDDLFEDTDALLRAEAGWSEAELIGAWRAARPPLAEALAAPLAALPRLDLSTALTPLSASSRALTFSLHMDPPLEGARFEIVHRDIPPVWTSLDADGSRRETFPFPERAEAQLSHPYPVGARVGVMARLWVDDLRGWACTPWRRLEILP